MLVSQLKQCAFLSAVPDTELETWAAAAVEEEPLVRRGTRPIPADHQHDLFLLTRGVVVTMRTSRSGVARGTGIVGPDGCVNIQCLFPIPMAPESLLALADTGLIRVPGGAVRAALGRGGALGRLLGAYAAARTVEALDDMIRCTTADVRSRAAAWLLRLADRLDSNSLPVSQDQLAAIVGVRRETLALVLGEMREEEYLDTRYRMIKLYDRRHLSEIAGAAYPTAAPASVPQPLTGRDCLS